MKTLIRLLVIAILSILISECTAQTLTIKAKILLNGKSTLEQVSVTIVDLNNNSNSETFESIKGFTYKLQDNKEYLIIFSREGYQSKSISVITINKHQNYLYTFIVDLKSTEEVSKEPRFSGGIYFNSNKNEFDYYLANYIKY